MSRLVHKKGWKITCGDESFIHIENGENVVINFNIIVPTEKGAVYACKYVRETELASVSMGVSVNIAHCLLGQRKEGKCYLWS